MPDDQVHTTCVSFRKHGNTQVQEMRFPTSAEADVYVNKHRQKANPAGHITSMGDWDYHSIRHE